MTETATEAAVEGAAAAAEEAATQPRSLEDLLAALPDDQRGVILGEVTKARTEAKNLRERLKAAEPKVAEFEKLTEAQKTEQQKAAEAQAGLERRAADAELRLMRYEVAAEKKLDPDLVQFLNAGTKEDLEKQADALLEKFAAVKPQPNLGQGVRGSGAGNAPDMNTALRRAAGRG